MKIVPFSSFQWRFHRRPLLPSASLALALVLLSVLSPLIAGEVEITPLESNVDASFRGLAVRGEQEAWVSGSGGVVLRTLDGGASWTKVATPASDGAEYRDIELLPDGSVLLMQAGEGAASRLLRSTDQGQTWEVVLKNRFEKGFFDGLAFDESGKVGVLYGDPIDGRLDVYRSSDGGLRWQRLPKPQRPQVIEGEYGFAASGSGIDIAAGHVVIATGAARTRAYHAELTEPLQWSSGEIPLRNGNASSGVFSIDLTSDGQGLAIGGDYLQPELASRNLARTIDGGKTWASVKAPMPHKACVKFLDAKQVLACGRTGVAFSSDAGANWRHVTKTGYFVLAYDRQSRMGYLAGAEGRLATFRLR